MKWNTLAVLTDIQENLQNDKLPVLLFKHSPRCPISVAAHARITRAWKPTDDAYMRPYIIHVIEQRPLSNDIATQYGVAHASPQLLLIKGDRCMYTASHSAINYTALKEALGIKGTHTS